MTDERTWRVLGLFSEMGEAQTYDVYKHEDTGDPMNITLPMQSAYRVTSYLENMGMIEVSRIDGIRRWYVVTPLGRFALARRVAV